jgi:hypothetical protein
VVITHAGDTHTTTLSHEVVSPVNLGSHGGAVQFSVDVQAPGGVSQVIVQSGAESNFTSFDGSLVLTPAASPKPDGTVTFNGVGCANENLGATSLPCYIRFLAYDCSGNRSYHPKTFVLTQNGTTANPHLLQTTRE